MRRVSIVAAASLAALAVAVPAVARLGAPPAISTVARVAHPRGFAVAPDGSFLVAEPFAHTVGRVSSGGTVTFVAGNGMPGYDGDGGPATATRLDLPHGVAFTPDGGFLIADTLNYRIRSVRPDGTIATAAGNGVDGFSGDGGPATSAEISAVRGIVALPGGGFLITDTDNQRIRKVAPDGTITTVAGDGVRGFGGDGGPATSAELNEPFGVSPLPDGGFLIADTDNERIRRVWPDGTITTVAGNGQEGFGGDGGPATAASLNTPHAVAAAPDGSFLIADTYDNRVRRVTSDGVITTVAGTGESGFSGDGGPPAEAELDLPKALAVLPNGTGFLVGDSANDRVRVVTLDLRPAFALTVAEPRLRIRAGRPFVLHLALSLAARVRLDVRGRRGRVQGVVVSRPAGASTLIFGRKLEPGRYRVAVTGQSADGRVVAAGASLVVVRP